MSADERADAARERARAAADEPLPEGAARRPVPDYGAPPASSTWRDGVLWLPRIALAPAYVASDLVAQPLMLLGALAEKHHLRERLHDLFTFGPDQRMALYPIAWLDLGYQPSAGAHFVWNLPGSAEDVRATVTMSGVDAWQAQAGWRVPLASRRLTLQSRFSRRDDLLYYGLGGQSSPRGALYAEQTWSTQLALGQPLASQVWLTTRLTGKWSSFDSDATAGQDTLARAIEVGERSAPPAFSGGVAAIGAGLQLELDNRQGRLSSRPRAAADLAHVDGSGVAARVQLHQHLGLQRTRAQPSDVARLPAWWSAGATLTGTLDLTGTQRRLELELHGACANPFAGAGEVPFSDQVSLGGTRPLRGFGSSRLVGRSAAAATLRYRWPIWSELDGTLHYAAGNVFGPYWHDLRASALRGSFGLGIATASASDRVFELLLAFGTESWGRGGQVESTRLAAGWNAAF